MRIESNIVLFSSVLILLLQIGVPLDFDRTLSSGFGVNIFVFVQKTAPLQKETKLNYKDLKDWKKWQETHVSNLYALNDVAWVFCRRNKKSEGVESTTLEFTCTEIPYDTMQGHAIPILPMHDIVWTLRRVCVKQTNNWAETSELRHWAKKNSENERMFEFDWLPCCSEFTIGCIDCNTA